MDQAAKTPLDPPLTSSLAAGSSFYAQILLGTGRSVASAALLMLALAVAPVDLDPGRFATPSAALADEDDPDQEDELGDEDDGSARLRDLVRTFNLDALTPIDSAEEEALLGDWGDSDNEDGD